MSTTEFARVTDAELEALRSKIGQPIRRGRSYVTELNADAIRHYAFGIGDQNPLFTNPAYAATTAHGGVLAPPSILFAMDKILSGYVTGLPGIHAMFAGADLRFERSAPGWRRTRRRGAAEGVDRAAEPLRRPRFPADL